jgi:hypothetical protein
MCLVYGGFCCDLSVITPPPGPGPVGIGYE